MLGPYVMTSSQIFSRPAFSVSLEVHSIICGLIYSGNWPEWRAVWAEIIRVISQVWFQTKIARHEVQLPLYYIHFEITQIQDKYFTDAVVSRDEIEFIHFLGKKKSFGSKSKICHMILFVFHSPAIRLVAQASLEIWLVVLFFVWRAHWLGKRCDLKQINGAIRE